MEQDKDKSSNSVTKWSLTPEQTESGPKRGISSGALGLIFVTCYIICGVYLLYVNPSSGEFWEDSMTQNAVAALSMILLLFAGFFSLLSITKRGDKISGISERVAGIAGFSLSAVFLYLRFAPLVRYLLR